MSNRFGGVGCLQLSITHFVTHIVEIVQQFCRHVFFFFAYFQELNEIMASTLVIRYEARARSQLSISLADSIKHKIYVL